MADIPDLKGAGSAPPRVRFTVGALVDAYNAGVRDFVDLDLNGANLSGVDLRGANLTRANLRNAHLDSASLESANLTRADLTKSFLSKSHLDGAMLQGAHLADAWLVAASLAGADFTAANLSGANLRGTNANRARLIRANLVGASFADAKLNQVELGETILSDSDIRPFCDATKISHVAKSAIDWSAVARSYPHGNLKNFLLRAGTPEGVAEYLIASVQAEDLSILQSTFISYGAPDEAFARRVYEALRAQGVTTYFFPESAKPGERVENEVYRQIQHHDRVLLICSRSSLIRPGVLNEIQETFAREARDGGATYLLPITIDDHVFGGWAKDNPDLALRVLDRVIADCHGAITDPASFSRAMERIIGALRTPRIDTPKEARRVDTSGKRTQERHPLLPLGDD